MKIEEIINLGKSILTQQHKYCASSDLEDIIHIPEMKTIVNGVSDYLYSKNYSESDIELVIKALKTYALDKFLEQCAEAAKNYGDTPDEKANKEYFMYIYEHEESPN